MKVYFLLFTCCIAIPPPPTALAQQTTKPLFSWIWDMVNPFADPLKAIETEIKEKVLLIQSIESQAQELFFTQHRNALKKYRSQVAKLTKVKNALPKSFGGLQDLASSPEQVNLEDYLGYLAYDTAEIERQIRRLYLTLDKEKKDLFLLRKKKFGAIHYHEQKSLS